MSLSLFACCLGSGDGENRPGLFLLHLAALLLCSPVRFPRQTSRTFASSPLPSARLTGRCASPHESRIWAFEENTKGDSLQKAPAAREGSGWGRGGPVSAPPEGSSRQGTGSLCLPVAGSNTDGAGDPVPAVDTGAASGGASAARLLVTRSFSRLQLEPQLWRCVRSPLLHI